MTGPVLVLNADYSPLSYVDLQRAVGLLLSVDSKNLPQAVMFESDPSRQVRSPSLALEWPLVIALTRYVYVPYAARMTDDAAGFATRRDILERDRYCCAYCGKREASTVDHVFPRSRGGADSWENLVACCKKCNNRKGNRTPEEWGQPLLWHPYRPDKTGYLQREIWAKQPV